MQRINSGGRAIRLSVVFGCSFLALLSYISETYAATNTPMTIVTQPASSIAGVGEDYVFSVQAIGTPPLTDQWTFNGARLAGANSS